MKQLLILIMLGIWSNTFSQIKLRTHNTESILYLGKGTRQPLIVGLGGSEGGNAWTTDYWKKTRDQFIEKGYAFLAIGYFGCDSTPKLLDKIALEDVYNAIREATNNKQVDKDKIALLGGSRGADLALLLASYYNNISCVVGMSSSHAVFPGHTQEFNSSCWTFQNKELPYIPVNDEAVPFLLKRDLRGAFQTMMKDSVAEKKAAIAVEKINGPVLLLSASADEIIPAVEMGEKMILRFKTNKFPFVYKQVILNGSHSEPTKHFDIIFTFLKDHFPAGNNKL